MTQKMHTRSDIKFYLTPHEYNNQTSCYQTAWTAKAGQYPR